MRAQVSLNLGHHSSESQPTEVSNKSWLSVGLIICLVPVLSLMVSGVGIAPYLEFPPHSIYVKHAPFSWGWWGIYLAIGLGVSVITGFLLRPSFRMQRGPGVWSVLVFVLLCGAWIVAWNRWEWVADIQEHTFLFIWLSYIAFMNVVLYEMHGRCPLTTAPRRYLLSFPFSGVFWWIFEFVNRFTQNWHYLNVENFSPLSYTLFATLSFSTVLPSVWVTKEFISRTLFVTHVPTVAWHLGRTGRTLLLLVSVSALALLPLFPDFLFALIWVVPVTLAVSVEAFRKDRGVRISDIGLWAAAGMWCGVLWELWNINSHAKWIYLIPYVQRYQIFEMPVVGYAGYLPFGVLCGMVIESLWKGGRSNVTHSKAKEQMTET